MTVHTNPGELRHAVAADSSAALQLSTALKEPAANPAAAKITSDASSASSKTSSTLLRRVRNLVAVCAGIAALVGLVDFGWHYWTVERFKVSTDDAYVQADNSTIAPKVSGYISEVSVSDNEVVKVGRVLARIDDRDYRIALEQAKANVEDARAVVESKQAAIEIQNSIIDTARATLAVDQAGLTFADQENKRYSRLAVTGSGSTQNAQQAASRYAVATASLQRDNAALLSATKQIDALTADLAQAKAKLSGELATLRQAELNLSYTTITAPIEGVVGNRTSRVGQYVQAGTQLMAIVPVGRVYVVGNFKETQLTNVVPGQSVEIEVDTFPGIVAYGVVDSIAPASGQQFALLPPDNATGNFTKIVQRIPVKIVLDAQGPLGEKLRPGMSVTPTIDTRATSPRATQTPLRHNF